MADKDQLNDEYQFADLDSINPGVADDSIITDEKVTVEKERTFSPTDNIRRNALIVIVVVILAMLIYKFLGSYFAEKKLAAEKTAALRSPAPVAVVTQPAVTQEAAQPSSPLTQPSELPQQPLPSPSTHDDVELNQKLSVLEVSQQSMSTEVSTITNQLGGLNGNINTLSSQIAQLNQTIVALSAKVESQAQTIEILTHPKPIKVKHRVRVGVPVTRYYIQAVIPGRAWLISPNGATLTVREGTSIPGYGKVKLIDPNQGRVITSSGQVIRFSQEDS